MLGIVGAFVGFIAIATIVVLVLAGPSVGSVFSAVSKGLGGVSTVEMARGFQQSPAKALNTTSIFKPTDQPLHCVVTLLAPPANTKVKTIWYTIEAGGSKDENLKELEIVTGGKENVIDFTLKLGQDWPIGTYKVEVYVNDVYSQSVNFSVQ